MIISYEIFWSENPLRTRENDDFYIKIINFDQFRKKKKSRSDVVMVPLPTGSHLVKTRLITHKYKPEDYNSWFILCF